MSFVEMKFKGKRVYVEVDDAGKPILENGLARMRYKPDDERTYSPWSGNLQKMDGTPLEVKPGEPVRKRTARAAPPNPTPAPTGGSADGAIIAYTDGGCIGNPGPAGLGYLIRFPDGKSVRRGEPLGQGTNNIAELTAILRVLEIVDEPTARIIIHTDSSYSIGVLTQNWKAKANRKLIARIKKVMVPFVNLELRKVKGHAGVPDNELVDDLARGAAETQTVLD